MGAFRKTSDEDLESSDPDQLKGPRGDQHVGWVVTERPLTV